MQFALLSLWSAWLIVTMGDAATIYGSGDPDRWNYVPNSIFNFFAPILMGNFDFKHPLVFVLLFGVLILGDQLGRLIRWPVLRIMYNLLVLSVLTATIDLISSGVVGINDTLRGGAASLKVRESYDST